jgi:predicted transglutaminase-like cysteine proteinase
MRHPLLVRALLGGAGLAGCVALLSGVARADDLTVTGTRPAPEIFGMGAVKVKVARYYEDWERARRDASADPRLQALIAPARGMPREQKIIYVHRAVQKQIRWMSDATLWGAHDYWASAAETLDKRAGDMEDRAILKMQALKALGFHAGDLFVTLGRDKVGGQITVLIVRVGPNYYVLDDNDGTPYTTNRRPEFTPILTFAHGAFWLHGYRTARSMRAAAATTAGTAGLASRR